MSGRNVPKKARKSAPRRALSTDAERALAEAESRRRNAHEKMPERELSGRDGPEPTRFGDWERRGIISDF